VTKETESPKQSAPIWRKTIRYYIILKNVIGKRRKKMKKHKSVVAILLAAMMIFTMMPMMAFATVTWDDNYKTPVSDVKSDGTQKAQYAWGTNGVITATSVWAGTSTYGEEDGNNATGWSASMKFYDLTGATLVAQGGKIIPAEMKKGDFDALMNQLYVKLARPSYTEGYATATDAEKVASVKLTDNAAFGGYTVKFVVTGYDPQETGEQNVTVAFNATTALEKNKENGLGQGTNYDIIGDFPVLNVKIKAAAASVGAFTFDGDAKKPINNASDENAIAYDGAAHTVVMAPVEGFTVAYSVFNAKTGKYDAVDAVSVTDVATPVKVRAIATKPATATEAKEEHTYNFSVAVTNAAAPSFGFDQDGDIEEGKPYYSVAEGETVNPADYILINNAAGATAADKAAVKANEALLKEYFNDFFKFESVTKKATPNKTQYTVTEKTVADGDFTAAELKALEDKYAQLKANFGVLPGLTDEQTTATVYVTSDARDYEVEFTKAITKKTFKANKKGKLAKNKSFTVKAVANNGMDISYKLVNVETSKISINKTTGKVTLKKGLKKGTYKIKIKAYVPGYSEVAYEYQTVTVKIKK
jgi:hypothetical protein